MVSRLQSTYFTEPDEEYAEGGTRRFRVILKDRGPSVLQTIVALRKISNKTVQDCAGVVANLPATIATDVTIWEARRITTSLGEVGALAEIQGNTTGDTHVNE